MASGCRIMDEAELESQGKSLAWRKDASQLQIHRIFGSEAKHSFPQAFQHTKTELSAAFPFHTAKAKKAKVLAVAAEVPCIKEGATQPAHDTEDPPYAPPTPPPEQDKK